MCDIDTKIAVRVRMHDTRITQFTRTRTRMRMCVGGVPGCTAHPPIPT